MDRKPRRDAPLRRGWWRGGVATDLDAHAHPAHAAGGQLEVWVPRVALVGRVATTTVGPVGTPSQEDLNAERAEPFGPPMVGAVGLPGRVSGSANLRHWPAVRRDTLLRTLGHNAPVRVVSSVEGDDGALWYAVEWLEPATLRWRVPHRHTAAGDDGQPDASPAHPTQRAGRLLPEGRPLDAVLCVERRKHPLNCWSSNWGYAGSTAASGFRTTKPTGPGTSPTSGPTSASGPEPLSVLSAAGSARAR